jgi:hypothetical protein
VFRCSSPSRWSVPLKTNDLASCSNHNNVNLFFFFFLINIGWIQEYENANQNVNDRIMRLFKLDD